MDYSKLKQETYDANLLIPERQLAILTWGNVSIRQGDVFAIKPSGVNYTTLKPEDIVIVDLDNNVIEGEMKPSSDTKTHSVLYKNYPEMQSIVHTHSTYAVAWAQTCQDLTVFGTTHADYLAGDIPCTELMADERIEGNYEHETGLQIIDCLKSKGLSPDIVKMVLVAGHGPFTWGSSAKESVENAQVLEEIAKMASITNSIRPQTPRLKKTLLDKHYNRKHGPGSYYGQN